MTRGVARKQFEADVWALNALWNEWDPIGVSEYVQDEYDSQAISTLSKLQSGITETELASDLAALLVDQFGIDPGGHEEFAHQVADWWQNEREVVEQ
jgi:hypothetical protein